MNGPDHFKEAERLLAGAPVSDADREEGIGPKSGFWSPSQMELRAAQVHATLALAAANASLHHAVDLTDAEAVEWQFAIAKEPRDA